MDFLKKIEEMAMEGHSSSDDGRSQASTGFSDHILQAASAILAQHNAHANPSAAAAAAAPHHPTDPAPSLNNQDHLPSGGKSSTQGRAPSKPAHGELLSSAKLVLEAAQGKKDVDKSKLAGAAANILGAVSSYGKLEDKAYGEYVRKAQEFLHSYEHKRGVSSHDSASSGPNRASAAKP